MSNKRALICGISGQDGAYLAKLLLDKEYCVWGTSRDAYGSSFQNLTKLGIKNDIHLISMAPEDFRSVLVALNICQPDEVYFLAGQSSVGLSFELPSETIQSIVLGTLNILEACKMIDLPIRSYHAGSSECFGDINNICANEETRFNPRSPYAVAKSSAYWLVDNYREAYNLYACTGILFNHESPLRPSRFVTQKIISTAIKISSGSKERLVLGNMNIMRDWGWAPEYVKAMWLMLQQEKAEDYVIATGCSYSLRDFVKATFSYLNLNWEDHVDQSQEFMRPTDILHSKACPEKAYFKLGWKASLAMPDIIKLMIEDSRQ